MEFLEYTQFEAIDLCKSFTHLQGREFKTMQDGRTYTVWAILPVAPKELNEFRDLITEYSAKGKEVEKKLQDFHHRKRPDIFTPALIGRVFVGTGVNCLTVPLSVDPISLLLGFRIDEDIYLR